MMVPLAASGKTANSGNVAPRWRSLSSSVLLSQSARLRTAGEVRSNKRGRSRDSREPAGRTKTGRCAA